MKSETGGDEGAGRHDHSGQDVAAGIAEGAATGFEKDAARFAAVVPSPSHQVAGRVVAAALAAQPETEATGLASTKAASTSVIKVLRLELQPADLGTITIRLSLKQDSLEIRLEAGRHDTAVMLQRDQDTLARVLSSAGYRVDGLSISVAGADSSTAQDGRTGTFQQSSAGGQWTGSSPTPDPPAVARTRRPIMQALTVEGRMKATTGAVRGVVLSAALAAMSISSAAAVENACEREMARAASDHGIPLGVLYAVGLTETGRGNSLRPYALNIDGKAVYDIGKEDARRRFEQARQAGAKMIDIGCMQINHRFHARNFASVDDMLDPPKNVAYAARFLVSSRCGKAVGRWRSRAITPARTTIPRRSATSAG